MSIEQQHQSPPIEKKSTYEGDDQNVIKRVEAKRLQIDEKPDNETFIHEDDEVEDDDDFTPPDPFHLKDLGNKQFSQDNVAAAIDIWKMALKEALKKSCRDPSKALFDLQMSLRMNLALGFMKEDDLVMAKEHMLVVFENKHDTPKVFYRLAEIYLGLQDYDKAKMMVKRGMTDFSDDVALKSLYIKIEKASREHDKQFVTKMKKTINLNLGDERSLREPPTGLKVFDKGQWKDLLCRKETSQTWTQVAHELIEWRHSATTVAPGEVQSDLDDWATSSLWRKCWTSERLKHDKSILHATIPLTILHVLESMLIGISPTDLSIEFRGTKFALPMLPDHLPLTSMPNCSKDFAVDSDLLHKFKLHTIDCLSRNSVIFEKFCRPFTIHCLGARGDMEMESKWGLILERCPALETLQVCMIGFRDSDDAYNRKLSQADEYLSPPLTKKNGWRLSQKVVARLYKGDYLAFLRSQLVTETTATAALKGKEIRDSSNHSVTLPSMLTDFTHPFYPDLIVIAEPDFSKYLKDWAPAIALLALAETPVLLLGQSVMHECVSHEAISIPNILNSFRLQWLRPLTWNPFAVPLDPGEDAPPMTVEVDGRAIDYQGPSGKYALTAMYQGFIDGEASTKSMLIRIANGEDLAQVLSEHT